MVSLYNIFMEMERICCDNNGVGLAAPQIGIAWNLFVVKGFGRFVNCSFTPVGEEQLDSLEGCLSLRDEHGRLERYLVKRYARIRLSGKVLEDLSLNPFSAEISDFRAIVCQHEAHHCQGILISDIGQLVELR